MCVLTNALFYQLAVHYMGIANCLLFFVQPQYLNTNDFRNLRAAQH